MLANNFYIHFADTLLTNLLEARMARNWSYGLLIEIKTRVKPKIDIIIII